MKIQVKNGDLFLVESNSILVYENQKTAITFDDEYTVYFTFLEDSSLKEHQIDFELLAHGIEFKLKNFNNPLGIALGKPLAFANSDVDALYISFCVYSIGGSKHLHYNVYKGPKESSHGKK